MIGALVEQGYAIPGGLLPRHHISVLEGALQIKILLIALSPYPPNSFVFPSIYMNCEVLVVGELTTQSNIVYGYNLFALYSIFSPRHLL